MRVLDISPAASSYQISATGPDLGQDSSKQPSQSHQQLRHIAGYVCHSPAVDILKKSEA